jgi:hypothetical protein
LERFVENNYKYDRRRRPLLKKNKSKKWRMAMENVYELFFHPGEVCEIRAIGVSGSNRGWEGRVGPAGIVSGYFDNADDFGRCAEILDKAGAKGVYFTLNPVNPALIARAANRLKVPKSTTQDTDTACIRWLPIDLDPKRPSDISASDEEVALAKEWLNPSRPGWRMSWAGPGRFAAFPVMGII